MNNRPTTPTRDDLAKGERHVDTIKLLPNHIRWMTNVTFLLGECLDSMLIDSRDEVVKLGVDYKHSIKLRWRRLIDALAAARRANKDFNREIYHLEDTDQAVADADWLVDLIYLITDRTGDDEEAQTRLRSLIYNLPSKCEFYEKIQEIKNHTQA